MAKIENENVYFPHFVASRNDRKIRRIRRELGVEGYGIFFMILEVLREQSDMRYPMEDLDLLADEFGTSEQKIRVVICNYGLFVVDDEEFFFSPKQIEYLQPYFEKSKRMKHLALKRWSKTANGENGSHMRTDMPTHSDGNAHAMQGKERKGKESKGEGGSENPTPVFILDLKPDEREDAIMKALSTTALSEAEKKLYYNRLASNSFTKKQGGEFVQIRLDTVRADAEYLKGKGWLKVDENQPTKPNPMEGYL